MSVITAPAASYAAPRHPPMKIVIAGTGYVGMSNAVLLAQHNEVVAIDIVAAKVAQVNARQSPIEDPELQAYLATKPLNLHATLDKSDAYTGADLVVIATPTNYNEHTNHFDTTRIEAVVADALALAPHALIVIKSTVPVGYTASLKARHCERSAAIHAPDSSLRAQRGNPPLHPSRIVVGEVSDRAKTFAALLQQGAIKPNISVLPAQR